MTYACQSDAYTDELNPWPEKRNFKGKVSVQRLHKSSLAIGGNNKGDTRPGLGGQLLGRSLIEVSGRVAKALEQGCGSAELPVIVLVTRCTCMRSSSL